MTNDRRFEQELPGMLAELAPRARPDYRDDVVRQTADMRQRPAWMFAGRWLPAAVVTTRAFPAAPVRWRVVGMVALLILALAIGLAVVAGSRPRVPPPFGPAGNGVVVYEKGGDIFTADPVTGVTTPLETGPQMDLRPVFSDDGTHLVFERQEGMLGRLVVARSDGTGQVTITPDPIAGLDLYSTSPGQYAFSPDGTEVAFWSTPAAGGHLWIAKADGTRVTEVALPFRLGAASWRPPDGAKLIVSGTTDGSTYGIYSVDPESGASRTIVAPKVGVGLDYVRVSPDGSRLAYVWALAAFDQATYRVHVVDIVSAIDTTLPLPPGAFFQDAPAWSNDGTRLAITRGYAQANQDMVVAVVPPDLSGTGIESRHKLTGCCNTILQWSPDDTSILVMPESADQTSIQHLLIDPSTLKDRVAPWTATDPPAWQRALSR
jgi:Tol biopolymer transport system component